MKPHQHNLCNNIYTVDIFKILWGVFLQKYGLHTDVLTKKKKNYQ